MKRIVIGIDPGTGASSPTGFVAFDPDNMELLHAEKLTSTSKSADRRLQEIAEQARELMSVIDPEVEVFVFVESFFIRGRGNQVLQQIIGALKAAAPKRAYVADVANTTMKKQIAGHGRAEKHEIGLNLLGYCAPRNDDSRTTIQIWIDRGEWDLTDAFGIGLTGWLALGEEKQQQKNKSKKKR